MLTTQGIVEYHHTLELMSGQATIITSIQHHNTIIIVADMTNDMDPVFGENLGGDNDW
jgi:hypothetical protein